MAIAQKHSIAQDYSYEHVTPKILSENFAFSDEAPRAGDLLPGFDLPLTDGGRIRTDDLIGKKPVLLITGSFTCPMTASSNPLLKRLYAEFGKLIQFVMIYVREAHPGELRDQPEIQNKKLQYAQDLKRRDELPWPIVVDDLDGSVHQVLDEKPNAAFLADRDGHVIFRALWAGDSQGLSEAMHSVARGERPRQSESCRRLAPMARGLGMMRKMMEESGPRAMQDIRQAAPPMAAMAWAANLFRPLPPQWRAMAAGATVAVSIATAAMLLAQVYRRRR